MAQAVTVSGNVPWYGETAFVAGSGDVADDPAIWIDPTNPSHSAIIGTDKDKTNGGLYVFDLQGQVVDRVASGAINNVDLRYGFNLGGSSVHVIGATNVTTDTIDFFSIDPATRKLQAVGSVATGLSDIYGFTMHRSSEGIYYAFVSTWSGTVHQFELDGSSGTVVGREVRTFDVGSTVEGMVVDDQTGDLYVAEEAGGLWKYNADPATGGTRILVDEVGGGHLKEDIEGLAIYYGADGGGYLIASSQGSDSYAVYNRTGDNEYLGSFKIPGVTHTDGLDVTNVALNETFSEGLLVVHDDSSPNGTTSNYKLVRWQDVAAQICLMVDTPGNNTPGSTPGTTPGSTPGTTPGSTPGTTPGSTPGTTPGSTPGDGVVQEGNSSSDQLRGGISNDAIWGHGGRDGLSGLSGDDVVQGNRGHDWLLGGVGNDSLRGGLGHDWLLGGAGDDILSSRLGDDVMTGDGGHDRFIFRLQGGEVTVADFTDGEDRLDFTEFGFASVEALLAMTEQDGGDITFTMGPNRTITLQAVQMSSLDATDVLI